MRKLDDLHKRTLANIELNAELPDSELARGLSSSSQKIRRIVDKLSNLKIIKLSPFIDPFVLGYRLINVFFSANSGSKASKERTLNSIRNHPQISWGAEIGGKFQFGICVLARSSIEVVKVLEELQLSSPLVLKDREIVEQLSFTMFPGKFLSPKIIGNTSLCRAHTPNIFNADPLDYDILNSLISGTESAREIARRLGKPASSIDWRVNRLRDTGVFKGFIYKRISGALGTLEFMVSLSVNRRGTKLRNALYSFCQSDPHVIFFIELLGAWDFELRLEVESVEEATETCEQLKHQFQDSISNLEIVPIMGRIKSVGLPLKPAG